MSDGNRVNDGFPRHDGRVFYDYRHYLRTITAAMSAPSVEVEGISFGKAWEAQFVIEMPAAVTSYQISLYRWVMGTGITGHWVLDQTITGLTATAIRRFYVAGDTLALTIHTIVGSAADGFQVYAKGVNKGA